MQAIKRHAATASILAFGIGLSSFLAYMFWNDIVFYFIATGIVLKTFL